MWLIRHGEPELQNGHVVLGQRTNPPLGSEGIRQAKRLAGFFEDKGITAVYASPLKRSRQTAELLAGNMPVTEISELTELDMGEWDGLGFAEIREKYPELYERRGTDNSLMPPGGEDMERAAARLKAALLATSGNCAVVSHSGVIRALLCGLTDTPLPDCRSIPQPYCGVSRLTEENGVLTAHSVGVRPFLPDEADIAALYKRCKTPPQVIDHCKAVAELSAEIAAALNLCGQLPDTELVRAAALLHDLCRAEEKHAERGAALLLSEGWPELAAIVRVHHDLPDRSVSAADEAAVLFFADKLLQGTERVSLERRFEESRKKCKSDEALRQHDRRFEAALKIKSQIEKITGTRY